MIGRRRQAGKRDIKKGERVNKPQKQQVIHNRIVHHPLTDAQPALKQCPVPPGQLPPVYTLGMTFYNVNHPFGSLVSCSGRLPPSFLYLLTGRAWNSERPWLGVSTTYLKYQYFINIILIQNPKQSSVPSTKKKINSIPVKPKTDMYKFSSCLT